MGKDDLLQKNVQELIDIIDGKKKLEDDAKPKQLDENGHEIPLKTSPLQKVLNGYQKVEETRIKNADITLLIEILTITAILLGIYVIYPYFTAEKSFLFSKEQLDEALKMPSTSFSVEEVAKMQQELDSLTEYFKYFSDTGVPYSLKAQGMEDLARGVIFLPIIVFIVTFIIPPFICLYLIWFIIKYWKAVIEATWGWFLMLYEYGTHLIEGKLGCKWYISMVTGWGCNSPKFSQYYDSWLKTYIIVPSYHEKIGYIDKYTTTKNKWFTIPKIKYFDQYKDELKTDLVYTKKIVLDRSGETFVQKLASFYDKFYVKPRDTLYKWVSSDKRAHDIEDPSRPSNNYSWVKYLVLVFLILAFLYFYKEIINFFTPYVSQISKLSTDALKSTSVK